MGVNYGFDRIRFVTPVKSGQRVRGRFRLMDVAERNSKEYLVKFNVSIEIDGSDKPAVMADWLAIFYFSDPPPL